MKKILTTLSIISHTAWGDALIGGLILAAGMLAAHKIIWLAYYAGLWR
ncbi:MAG TPA: hypothetical protein PLG20_08745 [Candidatus Syntrophosphaera sp.]|nr:hypothetical protein [Candidatus Syntrophosphaera sp.]